ncbi:uncharacterized protein [Panulirus ornatus]|uniref:uncharacterized protein isoform X3 n=1 Tax=Panulirus ornatus TaxID=150431 RepID=UPI003A8A2AA9
MKNRPHCADNRDMADPVDDAQIKAQHFTVERCPQGEEEDEFSFICLCPERHKDRRLSCRSPENHISFALTRPTLISFQPTAVSRSVRCGAKNQCHSERMMVNDSENNCRVSYRVPFNQFMSLAAPSGVPRCCDSNEVINPESKAAVVCDKVRRLAGKECVHPTPRHGHHLPKLIGNSHIVSDSMAPSRVYSASSPTVSSPTHRTGLGCRSFMRQKCTPNSRTFPPDLVVTPQRLITSTGITPRIRFPGCPLIMWIILLIIASLDGRVGVRASEFPDRECCDSAPPPPPHYHTTTSTTPVPLVRSTSTTTTPPSPPSFFPTSSVPPTGEGAVGVRNCLLARQLCAEDLSCRSVLEIIPRVCGPESVACSTVTVNKCLAALRTIQGFPYFQPTCLCREPHLDRECNVFREFIFDHPCMFVEKKDTSPYAVHALPLCEYALNACEQLPGCIKLYEEFRESCRVREDQCRMTDPNKCLSSWTKLKMSPMFGCICPMDRQKRKCERIFRRVHNNPCVDTFPASSAPPFPGQDSAGVWGLILPPPPTLRPRPPVLPSPPHRRPRPHTPWAPTTLPPHVSFITAEPLPAYSAQTHNVLTVDRHTTTRTAGNSHGSFPVNVIPYDNSSLHAGDTQIPNPLVEVGQGGGRRQNASRAANVLGSGRRYPTDPSASQTSSPSGSLPVLHSTCQTALKACNSEPVCRRLLDPVLAMCDNECNREACMNNLQTFYRNVESKWALEVAFCLCKNRSVTASECLTAQEKLHPKCAIHPPGSALMLCNRLAAACKEASSCRHRLEFYEQACAVDSDTQRCAGSTAECRRAVLGILGTQLRTLCTCAASDPRETYTCLDWHRILWFNPCVVESQMNYHREMLLALGPGEEVTTSASIVSTTTITTGIIITPEELNPSIMSPEIFPPLTNNGVYSFSPGLEPPATTTTTIPTTTLPPKYCEKRHANDNTIDYIKEGWGKRFYKNEECSELCLCHAEEKLACSVLECVEARPCETDYAVYTHAAPAYQASRGECFCYSGSFICVRPPQDSYSVNSGVFLFIGYSEAEEQLLRPYTKMNLVDAAMNKLGELVHESAQLMNGRDRRVSSPDFRHTKSECQLEVVSHIGENIILQATLEEFEDSRDNMSAAMLHKEKEACEKVVTEVGQKINSHAKEVREDMALSVLILAEVQVHVPPVPDDSTLAQCPHLLLLLLLAVLPSVQYILLAS